MSDVIERIMEMQEQMYRNNFYTDMWRLIVTILITIQFIGTMTTLGLILKKISAQK